MLRTPPASHPFAPRFSAQHTRLGRGLRAACLFIAVAATIAPAAAQDVPAKPAEPSATSKRADLTSALPEPWIKAFQWRSIGPANMSGRITAITVNEKDPAMWWAATGSGGLLKTVNNGVTFEHQFDHESTVSIGDVAVAPSDPNIVWVGSGESNPRNSVSWGDGVYKSTDGGKTWKNMGLKQGFQTGRIVIHPTDANTVYAGVLGRLWGPSDERGLYKTTDGGETWERILFVDDKTGVTDIQMKPGEPDTLLAATYQRQRDGFDTNEPAVRNGPGSGLWRTTDAGKTWARISAGLPEGLLGRMGIDFYRKDPNVVYLVLESDRTGTEPENAPYIGLRGGDADVGAKVTEVVKDGPAEAAGLKADDIVISVDGVTVYSYDEFLGEVRKHVAGDTIKVALSRERKGLTLDVALTKRPEPATPQRARDGTGRRTDDTSGAGPFSLGLGGQRGNLTEQQGPEGHHHGGIYKSTDAGLSWTRINSLNPRPMYFSMIRADPSDDNYLWLGGTALARSKDNGKTFTNDGGNGTHADDHALWIDPADGRHMILGTDGGVYVTYDRGENWDHLNHVAIGQFYHVAIDPRPNYMIYGGLQDNGSWGGPSRSRSGAGPINEDWISIGGGDGFVCRVDPTDPDQVYYESQGGAMGRFNFRTGERGSIRPPSERGLRYRWNWKTPFTLSSHNSRIFYAAAQYVFRSVDQGRTMKRISDELTRTRRGSATALAESELDSDVLYVGSDDGALIATRDGGRTWTNLVEFPLSEAEKSAQAVAEESESGGGSGAPAPGPEAVRAPGAEAPPPPEAPAKDTPTPEKPAKPTDKPEAPAAEAPAVKPPAEGEQPAKPAEATEKPATEPPAEEPRPARTGAGGLADRLKQMDANADGKIAKDEVPEQMAAMFDRFDANKDGVIDAEELKAVGQRPQGAGRGGAGRGPGGGRPQARPAEAPAPRTGGQILPMEPLKAQAAEAPKPAAADDLLTGDWSAKATGEELPPGANEFTLTLILAADGKVTGGYTSTRGDGTIDGAKFDAATGALTATVETERSPIEVTAKLADGKLKGEMEMAGGRFQFGFEADRTSTTPSAAAKKDDAAAPTGKPLTELLPGPLWVSSIEASRFKPGRVYVTFDGHRSNDDHPYVLVSEDYGRSWRSLLANLPGPAAGCAKVIREDLYKENLLFLGTEFGAYVSVDRGTTWTRFNNNLPTVAVFEFALHPTSGEIVAATHGRSLWILNVSPLREMSDKSATEEVALFTPAPAVYWRSDPRRGGDNRRFVGQNDESGATIVYSLGKRARSVTLQITDQAGEVLRDLEPVTDQGLHRVVWDLRRAPQVQNGAGARAGAGGGGGGGGGFGGRGRLVPSGTYRIALKVDGELFTKPLTIRTDPEFPDYQPWERQGGFGGGDDEQGWDSGQPDELEIEEANPRPASRID